MPREKIPASAKWVTCPRCQRRFEIFPSDQADTLVLTQWAEPSLVEVQPGQTEARPTTEVGVGFYEGVRKGKIGRAEALRQGQLKVLRPGGRLADPSCWGAWQQSGEWRAD